MKWDQICTKPDLSRMPGGVINVDYLLRIIREFREKHGQPKRTVVIEALGQRYALTGTVAELRRAWLVPSWTLAFEVPSCFGPKTVDDESGDHGGAIASGPS